jgi:hypothetical protein
MVISSLRIGAIVLASQDGSQPCLSRTRPSLSATLVQTEQAMPMARLQMPLTVEVLVAVAAIVQMLTPANQPHVKAVAIAEAATMEVTMCRTCLTLAELC